MSKEDHSGISNCCLFLLSSDCSRGAGRDCKERMLPDVESFKFLVPGYFSPHENRKVNYRNNFEDSAPDLFIISRQLSR